ncbi:YbhB/YbcL family Raf kinase inhibitor-like protein [Corynebacterium gerontici]|uniref:Putative kinase inhibitor protein n=1 Tax=Corynebacterium gerontici TaxID=2079234 RepID=A0A3G6J0E6_9CORY|nr:YbhB/YbcL family Raf kinase inhibitor-like protein [Corynebacterium gerontici]AZA11439.1 putative kinase inhibitor protein [Corynebacterium gerontici]
MTSYTDERFPGPDPYAPLKDLPSFPLRSDDFANGDQLGDDLAAPSNINPHLQWSDLPEGTKSVALTCFDPDAPTAAGFWHWAVLNIPVEVMELPRGEAEKVLREHAGVITLKGDSGVRGYYGPQPPEGHGPHRYIFAVHAVDTERLDVDEDNTPTVLGFNLYFHSIARSVLWGWYENE